MVPLTGPFTARLPASQTPIYRQIYDRIRQSIEDGILLPGDRVPSVRGLALELNLARGTVEAAYALLTGEGYLIARGPAGTVVSPLITLRARIAPVAAAPQFEPVPLSVQARAAPLPLQMGLPALDAFPHQSWNRIAARAMRSGGLYDLVYPDPQGHAPLRTALAVYLGVSRGIVCSASQVFICAGYRASLDLICRSVLQTGDTGWFEDPGYFGARHFLLDAGMTLAPVPVDQNGMDVEIGIRDAPDARFAVVTPSHQSPLGVSLSLARRHALLDWARGADSWIVEDDYDSEFRYRGHPLPALKSLDAPGAGRVLYTGTFSKVLAPGLCLSYLVVPPEQVSRFAQSAMRRPSASPRLIQATVAAFMEDGHFSRHIGKMRDLYAVRRAMLADAFETVVGDRMKLRLQAGGMHLIAMLDASHDDQAIASRAQTLGLAVQALSKWYADTPTQRGLIASFTNVANAEDATALLQRLRATL